MISSVYIVEEYRVEVDALKLAQLQRRIKVRIVVRFV
jgi:hypothetical protein